MARNDTLHEFVDMYINLKGTNAPMRPTLIHVCPAGLVKCKASMKYELNGVVWIPNDWSHVVRVRALALNAELGVDPMR